MDIALLLFGILFFVGMCIFGWSQIKPSIEELKKQKQRKKAEKMKDILVFNSDTKTLFLKKRCAKIAELVHVTDCHNTKIKYKPLKVHVGSATVGGITTGGAYTTGGYNYYAGATKNGKAYLQFIDTMIKNISLTPELYQAASRSNISDLLNDKKQIVVETDYVFSNWETEQMYNNMRQCGDADPDNKFYPLMYLPTEKIYAVMNWMTQEQ